MAKTFRSERVYIAPSCPWHVEVMIRRDAAQRGIEVVPHKTFPLNRLAFDQRTVAERKWRGGLKPNAEQAPCDIGLFSDAADQMDLVEMFMDPAED